MKELDYLRTRLIPVNVDNNLKYDKLSFYYAILSLLPRCRATTFTSVRGVTAPNLHTSGATANRAAPLQEGARSTGRGLRVRVVNSFGGSFVVSF